MNDIIIWLVFGLGAIAVPYGLVLLRAYVNANVKNAKLNAWANGAISFAGQAYVDLVALRQAYPSAPLKQLINEAVQKQATEFMASYKETADTIGATKDDAVNKITGELGQTLAVDPTVSVAATTTDNVKPLTIGVGGVRS